VVKKADAGPAGERSGTQSIERAVTLLREISSRGEFGWQLSDLAARCELGKSTAHRILVCLMRERLVRQRPGDRHYLPGPMLFELGLSVPGYGDMQLKASTLLQALAKRADGVAFLFFRSGDDFVCATRVGRAEQKAFTGFPGSRKPLVTSAGGAAILLALPDAEARAIVRRNLEKLGLGTSRARASRSLLKRTAAEGFAVNAGDLLPGVNTYALALLDSDGHPFASIMIGAAEQALPVTRLPEIKLWLQKTAKQLQAEALEIQAFEKTFRAR
jgi:DNA-binding IclR family transcriptional regulator